MRPVEAVGSALTEWVLSSGVRRLHARLGFALAVTLAAEAANAFTPVLLGKALNAATLQARLHAALPGGASFLALASGWILLRLFASAAPQARDVVFGPVVMGAQRRAAAEGLQNAMSSPSQARRDASAGEFSRTIDRGMRAVDFLLRVGGFHVLPVMLGFALSAVVLASAYSPKYCAVAVSAAAAYVWTTLAAARLRAEQRRELNIAESEAAGRAADALNNVEILRVYRAGRYFIARYVDALFKSGGLWLRANRSLALLNTAQAAIIAGGVGAVVALAASDLAVGRLLPGDAAGAALATSALFAPLFALGSLYREVRQSTVDLEGLLALRALAAGGATAAAVATPALVEHAGLRLDRVTFRYPTRDFALAPLSLSIGEGEFIGLVGPSGSGKSTLLSLIAGLEPPLGGELLHRSRPLSGGDVDRGYVGQDVEILDVTLRENIALGRTVNVDDLSRALTLVELDDFVRSQPDALDTRLGVRGMALSGGQRQRIAIARAIVADPELLLLDEATSALDPGMEWRIFERLRARRRPEQIIIASSHRLEPLMGAERIVVLDKGSVAAVGSHAELMAGSAVYSALWRRRAEEVVR